MTTAPAPRAAAHAVSSFRAFAGLVARAARAAAAPVVLVHVDLDECLLRLPPFAGSEAWYQCGRAAAAVAEKLAEAAPGARLEEALGCGLEVSFRGRAVALDRFVERQVAAVERWLGPEACEALAAGGPRRVLAGAVRSFPGRAEHHAFTERVREEADECLADPAALDELRRLLATPGTAVEINTSRGRSSQARTERALQRLGAGPLLSAVHYKEGTRVSKGDVAVRRALEASAGAPPGRAAVVALIDDRPDYVAQLVDAVEAHNRSPGGRLRPLVAVPAVFECASAAAERRDYVARCGTALEARLTRALRPESARDELRREAAERGAARSTARPGL